MLQTLEEQNLITLYKNNDFNAAATKAKEIIERVPSSFVAWKIVGEINYKLKNFEQAAKAFDISLNINSKDANGFNTLGVCLAKLGDLDGAIKNFNEAIDNNSAKLIENNELNMKIDTLEKQNKDLTSRLSELRNLSENKKVLEFQLQDEKNRNIKLANQIDGLRSDYAKLQKQLEKVTSENDTSLPEIPNNKTARNQNTAVKNSGITIPQTALRNIAKNSYTLDGKIANCNGVSKLGDGLWHIIKSGIDKPSFQRTVQRMVIAKTQIGNTPDLILREFTNLLADYLFENQWISSENHARKISMAFCEEYFYIK